MFEAIRHSFEAGRRGKPDEFESQLAELIGAQFLHINKLARFDLRVQGSYDPIRQIPRVTVGGEVSSTLLTTPELYSTLNEIILQQYNHIYKSTLSSDQLEISFQFNPQAVPLAVNQTLGDLGSAIGIAYADTPNYLPWERFLAVSIRDLLDQNYLEGNIKGLAADGKVEVNADYAGAELLQISSIKFPLAHTTETNNLELKKDSEKLITSYLETLAQEYKQPAILTKNIKLTNIGEWLGGGWRDDAGSREAKPYRDGFSSYGVTEDAFSGEDPSKPSATVTFIARQIAVSIVAAGIAKFARVMLSYAGELPSLELNITTQETSHLAQVELENLIRDKFDLTPAGVLNQFDLRRPELYNQIARNADFFHDPTYPWNQPIKLN